MSALPAEDYTRRRVKAIRRVETPFVRRHAARAIRERLGHPAGDAIIACFSDPDRVGTAILHVNSGGNAIAAETGLRAAGYRVEPTNYDPFAPGHYGVQIRVLPAINDLTKEN